MYLNFFLFSSLSLSRRVAFHSVRRWSSIHRRLLQKNIFCLFIFQNTMNFSFSFDRQRTSAISIVYNSHFTHDDVEAILGPLFESYYGRRRLRSIISKVEHTWCLYDRNVRRYIACALLETDIFDGTLYLKLFGVEQASQGQGIGTRLLKAIRKWAKRSGYSAITLHTQIDNYQAIGLYEKVGFRKVAHVKNFYRRFSFSTLIDFNQPDAYQMILYL